MLTAKISADFSKRNDLDELGFFWTRRSDVPGIFFSRKIDYCLVSFLTDGAEQRL